jgi:hypothetical protein
MYLSLPNYTNNWLRFGFTADDLADGGSDRLVDALVAWGSVEQIGERITAHQRAGADHVCLQVVTADLTSLPRAEWRALAALLSQRLTLHPFPVDMGDMRCSGKSARRGDMSTENGRASPPLWRVSRH